MSGPRAAVLFRVERFHLDECGFLAPAHLRRLRGLWEGLPTGAAVTLDLGALRKIDSELVAALALLPCAARLRVESADWRLAEAFALDLSAQLVAAR